MAVEVKRKQNESTEGLLRRFSQRMLQSRVIFRAKAGRYRTKAKTKRQIKASALRRKYLREKRDYLQKIGQLPEEFSSSGFGNRPFIKKK
ncbi:hypothetical protein A3E04_00725 [Candidatus Kuenenbacteria bacterium RIFCSPHIGHO2_12_FULL_42_14]|uniref:30S ribosomal protein S21 n=3 Tax=Candidatus Kueneniibacteriota TaxID=1752740 RepID=A0A0G1BVL2_9BACT|nr:MAG: hypothetical protein UV02_C0026G0002 [Candidatus Kuenenbacteria bacterium GW2011_GWA2_42_15]OGG91658.1 MAG: hypothetical protein A3H55_02610 [Candidatus Kuenenbacteria bacterium RIFCSPLOWO2_02_FULL_42_16]OGG98581.1 MAG: hypothetical protein A3E04_00725 [Candidatus Kuenenbacteria bacterium RIFCSPHIGHO2_12_FULL_42_14]